MRKSFGVTLTTLFRTASVFIALLFSVVASIILVRKLSPSDYALYQTLFKRVTTFTDIPFALTVFWIYRYMVQRVEGTFEASLAITLTSSALALILGTIFPFRMGFPLSTALLGGISLIFFELLREIYVLVDALRPVRYGIIQIVYRILYSSFVFLLVYILTEGVLGALISVTLSGLVTVLAGFLWVKDLLPLRSSPKGPLREWAKGIFIPLLGTVSYFIVALDVFLAYKFLGSVAVAAFFASSALFSLLREPIMHGMRYLQGYLLAGGLLENTLRTLKVTVMVLAPILAYVAVNPLHAIYIMNPLYSFATKAVTVMSFDVFVVVLSASVGNVYAGMVGGGAEEATKELLWIYRAGLLVSIGYVAVLVPTFLFSKSKLPLVVALWALTITVRDLLGLLINVYAFSKKGKLHDIINELKVSVLFFTLAFPIALVIRPSFSPSPRFFTEVFKLLPTFILNLTIYYGIVLLINRDLRKGLIKLIRLVRH